MEKLQITTRPKIEIREELSELQIGIYNETAKIDNLKLNILGLEGLKKTEHINQDQQIYYPKGEEGVFQMKYPEAFENYYERFFSFFEKIQDNDFQGDKNEAIIMVSHGNSIEGFFGLVDVMARYKLIIGVSFCCVSVISKSSNEVEWKLDCLGEAKHVGLEPTEVIDD